MEDGFAKSIWFCLLGVSHIISLNVCEKCRLIINVQQERMAAAKLLASLMSSEDVILENISGGLLEARSVLSTISSSDPSLELRQLCGKLLACLSFP